MASGKKIRNAADDPAGLVAHARMATTVRALGQAQRNAQDAISMLQMGECALQVVDQALVWMKELAAQAASDSYTPEQRRVMNAEFLQLADEVDRIAMSTTFNGIDLLSDGVTSLPILVGDPATGGAKTVTIDTVDVTAGGLGIDLLTLRPAIPPARPSTGTGLVPASIWLGGGRYTAARASSAWNLPQAPGQKKVDAAGLRATVRRARVPLRAEAAGGSGAASGAEVLRGVGP